MVWGDECGKRKGKPKQLASMAPDLHRVWYNYKGIWFNSHCTGTITRVLLTWTSVKVQNLIHIFILTRFTGPNKISPKGSTSASLDFRQFGLFHFSVRVFQFWVGLKCFFVFFSVSIIHYILISIFKVQTFDMNCSTWSLY